MGNAIQKMREWPTHHRKAVALGVSFLCTGLLATGWMLTNPFGTGSDSILVTADDLFAQPTLSPSESRARQDSYAAAFQALFPNSSTTAGEQASGQVILTSPEPLNENDYFQFGGVRTGGTAQNKVIPITGE